MTNDTMIKASREPANNGSGQNGYPGASSLTPGQPKPNNRMAGPECVLPANRGAETVADLSKIKATHATHPASRHRGLSDPGSPGGTVPTNNRPVTKR